MFRRVVIRLTKTSANDLSRLLIGGGSQPRCCLWQATNCLQSKNKNDKSSASSSSDSSSDSDSDSEKGLGIDQKLQSAAEDVAKAVSGQSSKVKSDLLQQLRLLAQQSKAQASGDRPTASSSVSDLFSGMKVMKQGQRGERSQMGEPRPAFQKDQSKSLQKRPRTQGMLPSIQSSEKVKLFEGPGLGIFTSDTQQSSQADYKVSVCPSLWETVQREQLDLMAHQPPTNAFEEMIQWTQEGKLWTFPINNEQGMEEETAVGFHEHIFLENQIDADFPRRGPVRNFMELVVAGLSKNPFLSVRQKHEHIDWFRQYFKEKQAILVEAYGEDGVMKTAETN